MNDYLKCAYCKNIFESTPLNLPCGFTICDKHMIKQNSDCLICRNHSFSMENCSRVKSIETKLLEYKLEQNLKGLKNEINNYKTAKNDPLNYIFEYFSKVKNEVDIRREKAISAVHDYFDNLNSKLNQLESECKKEFDDSLIKQIEIDEYEKSLYQIDKYKLTKISSDANEIDYVQKKLKKQIKKTYFLEKKLKYSISGLTNFCNYKISNPLSKQDFKNVFGEIESEELNNGYSLISGSDDGLIKIWNIDQKKCIKTFQGHTDVVNEVKFVNGQIISCSDDCTIKIWDMNDKTCKKTFRGHRDSINCIKMLNCNQIISGSDDCKIKIWNINGTLLNTLDGHSEGIFCLKILPNNQLVSGSADKTIKLWDIYKGTCTKTLNGHKSVVFCLKFIMDWKLISGSDDNSIKIWNIKSGVCLETLEQNISTVYFLKLNSNDKVIIGCGDCKIKVWDIDSGNCINTLQGHSSDIFYLSVLPNDDIISCSNDGTIKIWNLEEEKCIKTIENESSIFCIKTIYNDLKI